MAETAVATREPANSIAPAAPEMTGDSSRMLSLIERVAVMPDAKIENIERMYALFERQQDREAKAAYAAALADMQAELPVINRNGKIEIRKKDKDGERSGAVQQSTKYALWEDINEAIGPVLTKHGFALSFRISTAQDGKLAITGILSHRLGHQEETTINLMHDSTGSKNAVQAVGSSASYGKRYTAGLLLNFTSRGEDDDGKAAGDESPINQEQLQQLIALADDVAADKEKFCKYLKVDSFAEIPASRFKEATDALEAKRKKVS